MILRDDLQAEAMSLGFSLFGITSLAAPPHQLAYQHWLERGYHAGMDYLSNPASLAKRLNPQHVFPAGRAVLCLGMRYPQPNPESDRKPGFGRVAAYAWGMDYHLLIPAKLKTLAGAMSRMNGKPIQFQAFTDSGPILERDLSQRAGLGWIGKNTCLIHPGSGSYIFLAELIVDIDLQADPSFDTERCGTCDRCIRACPTGCINADRTIDARRCISYLTIENKGIIPVDLRPLIRDWVFGCDICQIVCPWNKKSGQPGFDPAFSPSKARQTLDLAGMLNLTPQQFNLHFRESPIKRAKRRGLLRNIAVAIGNQSDPAFLPALEEMLDNEPEPLVRAHGVWAVKQIHTPQAECLCSRIKEREIDPMVLNELRD